MKVSNNFWIVNQQMCHFISLEIFKVTICWTAPYGIYSHHCHSINFHIPQTGATWGNGLILASDGELVKEMRGKYSYLMFN